MKWNDIYNIDCIEGMKQINENSIDAVVTDPPYGLEFMNKDWDSFDGNTQFAKGFSDKNGELRNEDYSKRRGALPRYSKTNPLSYQEFSEKWSKEAYRILKPGGHMLVFGGSRTYHRMASGIEDAGFDIRDCIMWVYGCLSEDTEILTINGWERYHKGIVNNLVLCYDKDRHEFSFQKPIRDYYYENQYPAYRIKSDKTDQIVSRNHRVLIEREGKMVFETAEQLARKSEASIPILESLSDLPKAIYDIYKRTGNKKQRLSEVRKKENRKMEQGEKTEETEMPYLWQNVLSNRSEQEETPKVLFKKMCGKVKRLVKRYRTFRQGRMDGRKQKELSKKNDGQEQPCLEGWYNFFQEEGKLWQIQNKICKMPERLFGDGSQRRLCYGTSSNYGSTFRAMFAKSGSSASYQSQPRRQQNRKSDVISNKQRPQITRSTITETEYKGKVWCVEVPTGAFVARRNGKIFITGNSGFPKSYDVSKGIDTKFGAERTVVGKGYGKSYVTQNKINKEQGFRPNDYYEQNEGEFDITAPATQQAQKWQGWGTSLKPAYEPIILAKKPVEGTIVDTVLKYGTGALNIDESRIPLDGEQNPTGSAKRVFKSNQFTDEKVYGDNKTTPDSGRYPSNVIMDNQSSQLLKDMPRFFYVPKPSTDERDMGCDGLEQKKKWLNGGGGTGISARDSVVARNIHPTVKPIELMEYLVVLVCQKDGVVLDPFSGSGSTLIACKQKGINYIGFEKEEEYVNIAKARLHRVNSSVDEWII